MLKDLFCQRLIVLLLLLVLLLSWVILFVPAA